MAVLISVKTTDWMDPEAVLRELQQLLPDADLRLASDPGRVEEIEMMVVDRLDPGEAGQFPALRLVQKLGAGVEKIVAQPDLPPHIRVSRLKPDAPAREMAEFALAYVLRDHRHLRFYEAEQAAGRWTKVEPREAPEVCVGVLGLGHIGARIARSFAALDFTVIGYSRSPKELPSVTCHSGPAGLQAVLEQSDYLVACLPSTPETLNLMDRNAFAAMKPGACLINVGRGDLVVEEDLLASLDAGHLGGAVLDVLRQEPPPSDHPFWRHPKVTLTPHVSGWHLTGGFEQVAENYRRLQSDRPLINEVDRRLGY